MPSLHYAAGLAGILFPLLQTTGALPTSDQTPAPSTMFPRAIDAYINCNDDHKKKLDKSFADAAILAGWTIDHPIKTDHAAYTQYLRTEDGPLAKKVWGLVQQNNDPTKAPYHFIVKCSPGGTECPKGSLAITNSTPNTLPAVAQILICPPFFDPQSKETGQNLDSKTYNRSPPRGQKSWCQPGYKWIDFETGGHTLLHEMAHLDALGAAAGLSARGPLRSHGTDDVTGLSTNNRAAALQLKKLWDDKKESPATLKPVENAENLAAAATEWYFSERCGFDKIEQVLGSWKFFS